MAKSLSLWMDATVVIRSLKSRRRYISFLLILPLLSVISLFSHNDWVYAGLRVSPRIEKKLDSGYQDHWQSSPIDYGNIVLKKYENIYKKARLKKVVFSHWVHMVGFRCKACHENIFRMKRGASNINMSGIIGGESCGECHNGVIAFDPVECDKCHNYSEETIGSEPNKSEEKKESAAYGEGDSSGKAEEGETNPFLKKAKLSPGSPIFMGRSGRTARTGDPNSVAGRRVVRGAISDEAMLEFKRLPKNKLGFIDWGKAVLEGGIAPKAGADPDRKQGDKFEDRVILFETKSDFLEDVLFEHDVHTYWLDCKTCHNRIFKDREGDNQVFMKEMAEGRWCGECHGKVAFPLADCQTCHTEPKEVEVGPWLGWQE